MSQKIIRKLYETRLLTWAAARSPAIEVALQNRPFTPTTGTAYLKAYLLPADTDSDDLAGAHRHYGGVFQISVVAPINTGAGAAEGIGDELIALFPLNLQLTQSPVTVQVITPATQAPAIPGDNSYIVPVSFGYRADTT